jgi:hypothetical protein
MAIVVNRAVLICGVLLALASVGGFIWSAYYLIASQGWSLVFMIVAVPYMFLAGIIISGALLVKKHPQVAGALQLLAGLGCAYGLVERVLGEPFIMIVYAVLAMILLAGTFFTFSGAYKTSTRF